MKACFAAFGSVQKEKGKGMVGGNKIKYTAFYLLQCCRFQLAHSDKEDKNVSFVF